MKINIIVKIIAIYCQCIISTPESINFREFPELHIIIQTYNIYTAKIVFLLIVCLKLNTLGLKFVLMTSSLSNDATKQSGPSDENSVMTIVTRQKYPPPLFKDSRY